MVDAVTRPPESDPVTMRVQKSTMGTTNKEDSLWATDTHQNRPSESSDRRKASSLPAPQSFREARICTRAIWRFYGYQ